MCIFPIHDFASLFTFCNLTFLCFFSFSINPFSFFISFFASTAFFTQISIICIYFWISFVFTRIITKTMSYFLISSIFNTFSNLVYLLNISIIFVERINIRLAILCLRIISFTHLLSIFISIIRNSFKYCCCFSYTFWMINIFRNHIKIVWTC